ncbi:complex I subunit 4 family protein [Tuwongella immobilis]|uniref:NADH:quinone oxidoreductase/Mrp antiporter transmembrane domain-containing protein n=1 Tax=Tuwongella immobilis TaxID=692036 RepID=A0A6C2YPS3_9BACT|nr:NADH-quinone oxidoreductase subunit M [Tuwongella immobilis]VIP03179.1 proton-translocating nadh-quinone chain m : Proton-translocating NADH-quinone oxidoreductase, chain M OS=Blastopirellula marina DSM 3645 GN=DSM3645_08537 PE=4 SV=1: Oxidored_q1: Oxidored_q1 [Tuwongella immobilis]VTS03624.1 proton-translocating nadh-quinone chain m : Proton-translocating NADH-quinone oxidoreductase, chain M OS=Blastopirellula marina DSM 3645 GN=DSM3645_08537 PE=4 SV=1: Oxidored_q1: Oxidored_q1 [Tuwongella im
MEFDLQLMTAVLATPAAFGLLGLFLRPNWVELSRWWALFGSAITLTLTICMLIGFYTRLDQSLDENGGPRRAAETQLDARSDASLSAMYAPTPRPPKDTDWVARFPWIQRLGVQFAIGLDGVGMAMILLTNVICFVTVLSSWSIQQSPRIFFALLMLLQTGVIGAFLALDLFLFYIFYELMLIPMYLLIGIWGGERRKYAAMKFVIYTLIGSVCILIAIVGVSQTDVSDVVVEEVIAAASEDELGRAQRKPGAGGAMVPSITIEQARDRVVLNSFDLVTLQKAGQAAARHLRGEGDSKALPRRLEQPLFTKWGQYLFFALFAIGFAIKIPVFPLHSWLPDAHVEAPTPISMVLAGILLKLGGFGLIRFAWPICPFAAEQLATIVGWIAVASMVYGAFLALGQTDYKKLLAYSSISHMGFVVLGLAVWTQAGDGAYWAQGVAGAVFQMIAHGITAAGLFFAVGVMYDRAHHRDLTKMGGAMEPMPLFTGMSAILFFASMGLPGLCGFVGEILVMLATWKFSVPLAILAAATSILTAGYLLWTFQRVYLGTNSSAKEYPDLTLRESLVFLPLVILSIALGLLPTQLIFSWVDPSTTYWVQTMLR